MTSLVLPRRGFLKGLGLVFAAPAIVRASSLMPVRAWNDDCLLEEARIFWRHSSGLLTINQLTKEAINLWMSSNAFVQQIDAEYEQQDQSSGMRIGQRLRVRAPSKFQI